MGREVKVILFIMLGVSITAILAAIKVFLEVDLFPYAFGFTFGALLMMIYLEIAEDWDE